MAKKFREEALSPPAEDEFVDAQAEPSPRGPSLAPLATPAEFLALEARVAAIEARLASGASDGPRVNHQPPPVKLLPAPGQEGLPLWRVSCACPTPLQFPVLEVHAADGHQAKHAYCAQNGISDSAHAWKIEKVPQPGVS